MKWTLLFLGMLIQTLCWAQHQLAIFQPSLKELKIEAPVRTKQYTTMTFRLIDRMMYVEAEVDGESGLLILDTGSPSLVVNRRPDTGEEAVAGSTLNANVDIHETTVKYLRFGALEQTDVTGLAIPFGAFSSGSSEKVLGLAGYSLLKDYETLFDFENRRLHFFPSGNVVLHRMARPVKQIQLSMEGHLPVITLQIGDQKFRFGLDTGAATNVIDQSHLSDLPKELVRYLPMEQMRCLDGVYQNVEAATLHHLSLEGYPLQAMKFLFVDLSRANENMEEPLDGLLGYAFFSQLLCSINYESQRFHIWQRKLTDDAL